MERITLKGERHACGGPGQFILGRAEDVCPMLLQSYAGQVQLIYLDPPFGTGDTFTMQSGGKKSVTIPTYADTLNADAYLAMMRAVLLACYEMLSEDGSLYLHVDYRKSAVLRVLLDEIFGEKNFVNEIIWAYKSGGRSTKHYSRKHDNILFYRKSPKQYFDIQSIGVPRGPVRRNHMKRGVDDLGRVYYSIRANGKTYTYDEDTLVYPSDVWDDIEHLHQRDPERTGYSTQKPEALLRRIIGASSRPGDLVMDLFSGSGTTAAVAAKMDRAWVAADASPIALCMLRKRLLGAHQEFSLFDTSHAMAFTYELGDLAASGMTAKKTESSICASVQEDAALRYVALGHDENGIFLPATHTFFPKAGDTLRAAPQENVLQAVDAYGRQGFWSL
ncbi:MAG: site-specific DNA-methyltransferase [Clostridia bacterium]|nr:site-specific DNA-methyltransferase [Clostridia bacterium]